MVRSLFYCQVFAESPFLVSKNTAQLYFWLESENILYFKNMETYYQQNRETLLKKAHENYIRNREKRLEYSRQYYQKHKDKILEYDRQYYQTHKVLIYESQKGNQEEWRNENRTKVNEYKRNWRKRQVEDKKAKHKDDDKCITVKKSWVVVFD